MLASGDWVVPHLDGLRYFEKPVLGYWLNSIAMWLFGENAFAVRFASAMAAGISALCIFGLVRKFTRNYLAAALAPVILLTCLQFFVVGTISTLDSVFSMFVTAALTTFFFAYMEPNFRKRILFLMLFGGFCGLAFLTKGFLAFALPVVVIVPFVLWERRFTELLKICAVPIAAAVVIALPWGIMIYLREHDFWNYFFWTEHIKRFMSSNAQHPKPFWYFIPLFIGGTMPWTVLLLAMGKWVRGRGFRDSLGRFCACWLVCCFVFFSASRGKLPTYIMPCFPPFAVIATLAFLRYLETDAKRDFNGGAWVSAILAGGLIVALAINQITGLPVARFYSRDELWKTCLVLAAAVSWIIFSILAARTPDARRKLVFFCLSPLLFMFSISCVMPDSMKAGKAPAEFLLNHADQIRADDILIADDDMASAVCWFYKRNDISLLGNPGELGYGLNFPDSAPRAFTTDKLSELIRSTENRRIFLIAKERNYAHWKTMIPEPLSEDIRQKFAFVEFAPGSSKK